MSSGICGAPDSILGDSAGGSLAPFGSVSTGAVVSRFDTFSLLGGEVFSAETSVSGLLTVSSLFPSGTVVP